MVREKKDTGHLAKFLAIVALLGLIRICASQTEYQAIILHPSGMSGSTYAHGAGGEVQVGYHGVFGSGGMIWRGSPESNVYVRPAGASGASLFATDGTKHVGFIGFSGNSIKHAAIWLSDDPENYIDLHGGGYLSSSVYGIDGEYQVGFGSVDNPNFDSRALLWRGTAESMVSLHPTGMRWSIADAAHSGTQVGTVSASGSDQQAALWHGTAESFVNLSNGLRSKAVGVHGNQQVGWVTPSGPGQHTHAAMWFGSAESFVDMDPPGSIGSELAGTNGVHQVGAYAPAGGIGRAARWSGTPHSLLDLHQFLPPEYGSDRLSYAHFIDEAGIIVGEVQAPFGGSRHAVMWVPVPEPSTLGAVGFPLLALLYRRRKR